METPTQPQASVAPSAVGALLLACATYGANPNLSCAHVSAFRCFGVSRFRRCFGLVSGSLCEIVNKDAVCFGVSAFAPIFLTTRRTFMGPKNRTFKGSGLVPWGSVSALVTHGSHSEIASKYEGCNAVT